jgi:hypothetical protein
LFAVLFWVNAKGGRTNRGKRRIRKGLALKVETDRRRARGMCKGPGASTQQGPRGSATQNSKTFRQTRRWKPCWTLLNVKPPDSGIIK